MIVYGTRPEAIKLAPVVVALGEHSALEPFVLVTGQHREMLDQVNELFGIKPDHDLDLMVPGAKLDELATRALATISPVLRHERPDAVVVQGDTATAFIAGLASFYQQMPIIHVEAGLRTWNLLSPYPEEANRQLVSRIASLHLAPTQTSRRNLLAENIAPDKVVVTGNTVIDALYGAIDVPTEFSDPAVAELVARGDRFVVVTAHRRESWGAPMRAAMLGLRQVAQRHPEVRWLLPMHRNPIVRDVIADVLGDLSAVHLTEPMTYHEFSHAMKHCHLLVTDSGGVQEEAPSLGKPVLVMRDTTERPEAVDAGTVRLVGTDTSVVAAALDELLDGDRAYARMANAVNPYGDGQATRRSISAIEAMFGLGERAADFNPGTVEEE